MEQNEVEKLIGELETGLDRLRSLYEQYFVGIERIEPGVARKDVERRLYVLRKEQIRNTALRYRFQMVLQKFNTYQTHWLRICREIENGTYKRHLLRAQRRFGSSRPPRRRTSAPPPPGLRPDQAAPLPGPLAGQRADLDDEFAPASFDIDVQLDDESPSSRLPSSSAPVRAPGVAPLAPPAPALPRPGGLAAPPVWKKKVAAPVPPTSASPSAPAPPTRAPQPAAAAPVVARPLQPAAAAPVVARPLQPAPAAPVVARPLQPAAAAPGPSPSALSPPRPPSLSPPTPSASSSELSEKRLRQIYVEYVDAKRRQHESTAAITYQAVAKSLRESGDKLREKHGKSVDFEVAVKDGKTILRPVLK